LVADVQGRAEDTFVYPDGRRVHPMVFAAVAAAPDVLEYQVRQTLDGAEILLRSESSVDAVDLARRIEDALAAAGLSRPRVMVTRVASLPRGATGKLRRFVPMTEVEA
jgi:phenylacetate-coenzyme A ligase PaaK-like adenylate-forming protein